MTHRQRVLTKVYSLCAVKSIFTTPGFTLTCNVSQHRKPYQKVHPPITSLREANTDELLSKIRSTHACINIHSQLALRAADCLVDLRIIYSKYTDQKEIKKSYLGPS